jgi:hypothetical protein
MYSRRELMLDICNINKDFYELANLYESNNIPGFIIKKQFQILDNNNKNKNKNTDIRCSVKQALFRMSPSEREEFIKKQRELWDWGFKIE